MKINVIGEFPEELKIQFSQGTWNVAMYTLFENRNSVKVELPNDPTILRLSIKYDSENCYFENVLYHSNPNRDQLKFDFYKEINRIFCRIQSDKVIELNKEIILHPVPKSITELLNEQ